VKRSETICARCKKNPRAPYSKNCDPCRDEVKVGHQKNHILRQRKTRAARKQHIPCICGCGKSTVYPTRYATEECREKGKSAATERANEARRKSRSKKLEEKEAAKPLTPAQIKAREEEQEKQRAIASELDRRWQQKYWQELGLESAPGQPLASKVVTPPKEVWEQLQRDWKPQTRDGGTLVLPYLCKDYIFD
jgi:hypothetical protein